MLAVKVQETPKFQPFQKVLAKDSEKGIFDTWHCCLFLILQKKANILPLPVCGMNVFF